MAKILIFIKKLLKEWKRQDWKKKLICKLDQLKHLPICDCCTEWAGGPYSTWTFGGPYFKTGTAIGDGFPGGGDGYWAKLAGTPYIGVGKMGWCCCCCCCWRGGGPYVSKGIASRRSIFCSVFVLTTANVGAANMQSTRNVREIFFKREKYKNQ